MKNFKKSLFKGILIGAAFSSALVSSGCAEDRDYLNTTETVLLRQCEIQTKNIPNLYCSSSYKNTISMAPEINSRGGNPNDKPFQQQGITFVIEDRAFKKQNPQLKSLNELWNDYTGGWIYSPNLGGNTTEEIKKVNNSYVLSPQIYDELISATKVCNRATISAMQFPVGKELSPEEYDKVMTIILDCKKFQLEKAVNEK